jgi:aerobic-type carbon monoxide dehydrogenase small subunit (CoxS/CutS family)
LADDLEKAFVSPIALLVMRDPPNFFIETSTRPRHHNVMRATTISLNVNGAARDVAASDAERPLLWYLRDRLGLDGTKFGCGHGGCGACTVEIGGHAAKSCVVTVAEAAGKDIVTIEGLAQQPDHPIFRAWLAEQVPQCGYCQPGMIMATAALLEANAKPSDADIDAALSHVLCRCGSYQRVRNAVHRAAEQRWNDAPFPATPLPPPRRSRRERNIALIRG